MIKVTGQDPIYKHCFSVLVGKISFFVNVKHDIVKINIVNDMGSKRVDLQNKIMFNKLLTFVKNYVDTNKITVV